MSLGYANMTMDIPLGCQENINTIFTGKGNLSACDQKNQWYNRHLRQVLLECREERSQAACSPVERPRQGCRKAVRYAHTRSFAVENRG